MLFKLDVPVRDYSGEYFHVEFYLDTDIPPTEEDIRGFLLKLKETEKYCSDFLNDALESLACADDFIGQNSDVFNCRVATHTSFCDSFIRLQCVSASVFKLTGEQVYGDNCPG